MTSIYAENILDAARFAWYEISELLKMMWLLKDLLR